MAEELIARRKALRYVSLLMATAGGREFLAGWLPSARAGNASSSACHAGAHTARPHTVAEEAAKPYTPQFFKPEEFETVEILSEMIIPTDDKPGAKEAQVARYIDFVVFSAAEFAPHLQQEWSRGLALLDRLSQEQFGRPYRQLSPRDRERLLVEMSLPERDSSSSHEGFSFYRLVKEMTVAGFYTSRAGLLEVLEYKGLDTLSEFPGCTHPEHQ